MNNSLSLANKYRPMDFKDVSSQQSLIKILSRQLETKTFKNCYLFCGSSGVGKTTIARIFANKINQGCGQPIEMDAASMGRGEDGGIIGAIVKLNDSAQQRSIDSEYKIFIIDECHALSNQAWQALLKTIEEPPKFTIFMFCTTDPQKIPATIVNRCQVYTLSRINDDLIKNRLKYICSQEGFTFNDEALDYITRLAEGSMRQAISYLDKCKDYSTNIILENVIECLGDYSYDVYFNLTNAVIDNNKQMIIQIVDKLYSDGNDLKLFISKYLDFILQLMKYCLFNSMQGVYIPKSLEEKVKYTTGIEDKVNFFNKLLDKVLDIKKTIKGDSDLKTTIEVMLLEGFKQN